MNVTRHYCDCLIRRWYFGMFKILATTYHTVATIGDHWQCRQDIWRHLANWSKFACRQWSQFCLYPVWKGYKERTGSGEYSRVGSFIMTYDPISGLLSVSSTTQYICTQLPVLFILTSHPVKVHNSYSYVPHQIDVMKIINNAMHSMQNLTHRAIDASAYTSRELCASCSV